ncbi:alpha/beta fold hydrolase [Spongiimicrobium salis]|uniref:alpha/beta fold hydrolase n=1 Tax=Spongiimicrobium salis TaxID=1667022 RepID=UPI00374D384D
MTLNWSHKTLLFGLLLLGSLLSCKNPTAKKDTLENAKVTLPSYGHFKGADDLDIFYQIKGKGKDTLVIVHGGPGMDSEYMVADFEPLAQKHTLIYYDQRGGGRSSLPENTDLLHIDRHVEDLEALRSYFKLDRLKIIGHSFGPMVVAKYAIAYPQQLEKMVFLGPVPPMQGDFFAQYGANLAKRLSPEQLEEMGALNNAMLTGDDPKKACQEFWKIGLIPRLAKGLPISVVKGDCCAAPAEAIRYGMGTTNATTFGSLGNWDLRPDLAKVNTKTLILHGEEEAIPMDMVTTWTTALPNATLIKVPNAGHFSYVERPDIVWPAIEAFLK